MIPTPDLSHLSSNDFRHIYEPAEDTFLLLDALEQDALEIKKRDPKIGLEVGSGSGCVTAFLGKILEGTGVLLLCTDINPRASVATKLTCIKNNVHADVITTSLCDSLLPRLRHKVDILYMNPPYVLTTSDEVGSNSIEAAWAGGKDGREIIDRMIPLVSELLSPTGMFYLLVISENKPHEILDWMKRDWGLHGKIAMERKAGREKQYILKFWR
ncbi:uncharacterized protein VTP21DRAFT_9181 [Calcarisporiella thermophila]|uniref:uncharacterized protein n=1 Tax=Calcarisporiella thermophila TaxID=911321 RepID=UPI003743EE75